MKTISVVIPCWSEEKSVATMYTRIKKIFEEQLQNYRYEIIFVDDASPDQTWAEISKICRTDKQVTGIRNAKNFGFTRNVFATLCYGTGDATFMLFGDMQDPPENLPQFVEKWEEGYKVVIGQKTKSGESKFWYLWRVAYYKLIGKLSLTKQVPQYNGYGLYDRSFIKVMKQIEDPAPYLKGLVAEFGMDQYIIQYHQAESNRGSSGFNFMKYYDVAMIGITSYTKTLMRVATFAGVGIGTCSLLYALFVFINKLLHWDSFPVGIPTIVISILFLGAIQLFFTGILGEYILSINTRTMKRPLVVIGEKLNFEANDEEESDV